MKKCKCKAVMMGVVVLSGLVFSSTEARADMTITDLMEERVSLEKRISELDAEVRRDLGLLKMVPAADNIKIINKYKTRIMELNMLLGLWR
ncbi:hypothetical protein AGMMS49556_06040 [Endomicrobiia bacterium]|nr:hypothetical protein AGMMS49556_06040 [Endomicrobiia bacterium]